MHLAGHAEAPAVVHVTAHEPHHASAAEHPCRVPRLNIRLTSGGSTRQCRSCACRGRARCSTGFARRAGAAQTSGSSWSVVKNRFTWQGGRVSIVGTLALSLIDQHGPLFAADDLEVAADEADREPGEGRRTRPAAHNRQPGRAPADRGASRCLGSRGDYFRPRGKPRLRLEPALASSDDAAQRGLDDFFATNHKDATANPANSAARGGRAPMRPIR